AGWTVKLRIGARVMLLANVSVRNGLVNGACGTVVRWETTGRPVVRFADGTEHAVERHAWTTDVVGTGGGGAQWVVRHMQMPLRLAYATTIHKAQGLSMHEAEIKLDGTVFAEGQAYVALSRVRSKDGLRLIMPFDPACIRANPRVLRFYGETGAAGGAPAADAAGVHVPDDDELRAMVRTLSDADALEVAIIDNLQREDLHPLDEAQGYAALLNHGFNTKEIGLRIGKSDSYVQQRLVLQKLIPAVKKDLLADKITFGHGRVIARLTPEQQKQTLAAVFDEAREWPGGDDGPRTIKELIAWIQRNYHLDLHAAAFDKGDANLLPTEPACTTCPKRTGANPSLFPEVKKADTCTDPPCFRRKLDMHLVKIRKLHKDQLLSGETILLSDEYNPTAAKKQEGRARSLWEEVKKGSCPHVQRGILVDGPRRGHLLSVCTYSKCPKHRGVAAAGTTTRAGATERAQNVCFRLEQDAKKLGLQRSLDLILERVQSAPARDRQAVALRRPDLNDVAVSFYLDIWYERRKRVAEMMGWDVKTTAYGNNTDAFDHTIDAQIIIDSGQEQAS
ncbi:hypothetical protein LCGC14_2101800, partial [marine sediment metagenome]